MLKHIAGESITLTDLTKEYGSVRAVDSISLQISAGEFVSLLGPSGSGKTTTLMMIAGFEGPSSGQIFLGDRPITDLPAHDRGLGIVFQSYALFPHLTIFENIAFPLKMRGIATSEVTKQVKEALDLVRMASYTNRYPHELSGGQQQRIALARSLVFRPSVVLMDEPLGALDKQLREHMQIEIKQLQNDLGMTVIYVTHDQSEALAMSDRIVVMNNARIEQVGTPEALYERPETPFVASFIGDSNFITGEQVDSDDRRYVSVAVANTIIRADAVSPLVTQQATLLVRPEKITLSGNRDGVRGLNVLEGKVAETVYQGSFTRYLIHVNGVEKTELTAVTTSRYQQTTYRPGDSVFVSWAIEDTRLITGK